MSTANQPGRNKTLRVNERETAVEAAVRAISTALDCPPEELQPLQDVVDTDALNTLFTPGSPAKRSDVMVTFTYEGHEVRMTRLKVEVTTCADRKRN